MGGTWVESATHKASIFSNRPSSRGLHVKVGRLSRILLQSVLSGCVSLRCQMFAPVAVLSACGVEKRCYKFCALKMCVD
eukprot:4199304-Amphidinium_carterae.1